MQATQFTVDAAEIAKFEAWRQNGGIQTGNLNRCICSILAGWITSSPKSAPNSGETGQTLCHFQACDLDIGCGGGLLREPMARLGADVVALMQQRVIFR